MLDYESGHGARIPWCRQESADCDKTSENASLERSTAGLKIRVSLVRFRPWPPSPHLPLSYPPNDVEMRVWRV